jgi:hypothetical protein
MDPIPRPEWYGSFLKVPNSSSSLYEKKSKAPYQNQGLVCSKVMPARPTLK